MTETQTATLEQRVLRLEDIEEIRALSMNLARHFDDGYNADAIVGLFTEDGVFDGGAFGAHEGREAIHAFFSGITAQITFAKHHLLATHTIDIDPSGESATGLFYMWGTHTVGGNAMFLGINWDNRYEKVDGRWHIAECKLDIQFFTPYEEGWVKNRMAG